MNLTKLSKGCFLILFIMSAYLLVYHDIQIVQKKLVIVGSNGITEFLAITKGER
jgi:hypothetical protein